MVDIALALAPIFILIVIGHLLKRWNFLTEPFWASAEKLTYYVTFPPLLAYSLAKADLGGLAWEAVAIGMVGATLAVGALALATRRAMGGTPEAFTSAFQGAVRPNTYIGLAGAASLFGAEGVTLTAVCIAAVVPLVNVLAVACISAFVPRPGRSVVMATVLGIARNPLVLGCVVGITLNLTGIGAPLIVGDLMRILGAAALPIGLLAVGAGLALDSLRGTGGPLLASCALKLVALPLIALLILAVLWLIGVEVSPTALGITVLYAALPCSASSYVLARQMGGDAPVMANIITLQTLLAAGTIPALFVALAGLGLVTLP